MKKMGSLLTNKIRLIKSLTIMVTFILIENIYAEKIEFAKVKSEANQDTYQILNLNIEDNTGEIKELILDEFDLETNKLTSQFTFKATSLKNGIVLFSQSGLDIVTLTAPFGFNFFTGGKIVMQYLTNGIKKKYSKVQFDLGLDINNKWALSLSNDINKSNSSNIITQMYFKSNKVWPFGVVGIKKIDFTFTEI